MSVDKTVYDAARICVTLFMEQPGKVVSTADIDQNAMRLAQVMQQWLEDEIPIC